MRRRQLIELEDQAWFPAAVRDGATDWLRFMADVSRAFVPVAPLLERAMERIGVRRVVDLCSGGGGPWHSLEPALRASGDVTITLTDLYPNADAMAYARAVTASVESRLEPVDATDVPEELEGVRTLFNAFHHFPKELGRAIVADAIRKRQPIAIFEGFHHRALGVALVWMQLPTILLLTPFVRPFSWRRLFLTYAVPAVPFVVLFDGTMSMFRLYFEDELREMVESIEGHETFEWDIGTTGAPGVPLLRLTHLLGIPRAV